MFDLEEAVAEQETDLSPPPPLPVKIKVNACICEGPLQFIYSDYNSIVILGKYFSTIKDDGTCLFSRTSQDGFPHRRKKTKTVFLLLLSERGH